MIESENSKNLYTGNDVTVEWPFTFKITEAAHLQVIKKNSQIPETLLVEGTDYTIEGVGDEGGGTVTCPKIAEDPADQEPPLTDDDSLALVRVVPILQSTSVKNQASFYPSVLETVWDRLTMICQQLSEQVSRCAQYGVTSGITGAEVMAQLEIDVAVANNSAISAAAAALAASGSQTAAAASSLSATNSSISAMASSVSAKASSVSALASSVSALESSASAQAYSMSCLTSKNSALASSVSALASSVSALASSVSALASKDSALASSVSALASKDSALASSVSALASKDSALASSVSALESSASALVSKNAAAASAVAASTEAAAFKAITTPIELACSNNQSSSANLTGLTFDSTLMRSFRTQVEIYRKTDSETKLVSAIVVGYFDGALWDCQVEIKTELEDSAAGVTFGMTTTDGIGQLTYISTNMAGDNYTGTFRFLVQKFKSSYFTAVESSSPPNIAVAQNGANSILISLKTYAGNDPTEDAPVLADFCYTEDHVSKVDRRVISAGISTAISAGSTGGLKSSMHQRLYVFIMDTEAGQEVAWSATPFHLSSLSGLLTTSAEGGSGNADSPSTAYSTTARTGVPFKFVAVLDFDISALIPGEWAPPLSIGLSAATVYGDINGAAFTEGRIGEVIEATASVVTATYETGGGTAVISQISLPAGRWLILAHDSIYNSTRPSSGIAGLGADIVDNLGNTIVLAKFMGDNYASANALDQPYALASFTSYLNFTGVGRIIYFRVRCDLSSGTPTNAQTVSRGYGKLMAIRIA